MMNPLTRAWLALVLVLVMALPIHAQNVNVTTSVLQQYVDGIEALLSTIAGDTTDIETAIELLDEAAGITPSDNFANPTGALVVYALTGCWDGATWDRCTGSSADTELPAAAAAADNMANPTAPFILAANMCWDGATWDRCVDAGITPSDNFANPTGALVVYALTGCWDGSTWDRCTGSSADTELPAAAAAADNMANPTAPFVLAANMCWDGATWDRCGASADTELPTSATLADNTANPSLPAVAAYMMCFDGSTWDRCGVDGATPHYRTSAGATEDEHEIKATAGTLYSVLITNTNAAARYVRCYNLTAANTTPGTSTVLWGAAIPGATTGAGFEANFPAGLTFSTALTCAWTTGAADTDVAEVAANDLKATYTYR